MNATCLPSGDHDGLDAPSGRVLSCTAPPAAATSSKKIWSAAPRRLRNAMLRPSGDHSGE